MTREDAIERLSKPFRNAVENDDSWTATITACELYDYAPVELLSEICNAFQSDLIDQGVINQELFERAIAAGEQHFQRELGRCRPTGIPDTVEELRKWAAFAP